MHTYVDSDFPLSCGVTHKSITVYSERLLFSFSLWYLWSFSEVVSRLSTPWNDLCQQIDWHTPNLLSATWNLSFSSACASNQVRSGHLVCSLLLSKCCGGTCHRSDSLWPRSDGVSWSPSVNWNVFRVGSLVSVDVFQRGASDTQHSPVHRFRDDCLWGAKVMIQLLRWTFETHFKKVDCASLGDILNKSSKVNRENMPNCEQLLHFMGFPCGPAVKNLSAEAGDMGSIPG